jgi:cytochrome b subunit of formate dehydrogenase
VHFEIPAAHGIELVIACLFLVTIALTFGPSLAVTALKLLHHALGRHDPDHQHYARLADVIMSNPHGRKKLVRFELHQRLQHWLLAVSFTTLCLTGFPMKFAAQPWAAWMIARFGGLAAARLVHRAAGTLLITGFVYHLVYVLNLVWHAKKRSGKSLRKTLASMPMSVGPRDGVHLMQLMLYLCFLRKTKPSFGKFNPEEKFEYFGVFWGTFMLGVTGLLMWANGWTTRHLPGRILTIAALLHTFEAFLALLHIGIVHLANVVFHPESFPVSKAMLTGETPRRKLADAHGRMLKQVAADMGMTRSREVPHA